MFLVLLACSSGWQVDRSLNGKQFAASLPSRDGGALTLFCTQGVLLADLRTTDAPVTEVPIAVVIDGTGSANTARGDGIVLHIGDAPAFLDRLQHGRKSMAIRWGDRKERFDLSGSRDSLIEFFAACPMLR